MQMGGSNMERDSYVYKTPASKLVQVAAIAAEYKDRPDMLMTVLIRAQKDCAGILKSGRQCYRKGDEHPDEPGLQLCNLLRDAFGETSGQIHRPHVQERPVPCPRSEGDRGGHRGSARNLDRRDDRGRKIYVGILPVPGTLRDLPGDHDQ